MKNETPPFPCEEGGERCFCWKEGMCPEMMEKLEDVKSTHELARILLQYEDVKVNKDVYGARGRWMVTSKVPMDYICELVWFSG